MPVAPLLQRFVDDEFALAPMLIEQVRAAAAQQLQQAGAAQGVAAPDGAPRREAARALQAQASRFCTRYVDALRGLVRADLEAPERAPPGAAEAPGEGLALMDEALVESDIEISRAAMLIDSTVEAEQRDLQAFTSALRGEVHVGADSNPLRPALVARALWQATDVLALAQAPRVHALRATAAAIGSALKLAYAAACHRIAAEGVEPSLYRTRLLAPCSTAGGDDGALRRASFDVTRPGALHGLLAAMPVGDVGAVALAGAGPAEVEQTLVRLDALSRRAGPASPAGLPACAPAANALSPALAALASQPPQPPQPPQPSQASQVPPGIDPRLLELLSRLFDAILADPALPAPAKAAIARLQASALRVALRDPALLDRHDHPTWRLMDRIASACQQAAAAGPARLAALALACAGLADELGRHAAPDATLYRQAATRLDALVADDLRRAQQAANGAIAALQRSDNRIRVQAQVQARLEEQFVRSPVGVAARRFLLGPWAQGLAGTIVEAGPDSEATAALTRCIDDLLWSLHPPAHPASRQRLVKLLPGLLARLRASMAHCGLGPAEQQAVLDELEASHSATLWPGGGGGVAAAGALETPEDIVRRLREEVFDDTPPRRDFGDSVLDLSTLDTVPAELLPDDAAASPTDDRAERTRRAPAAVAALPLGRAVRLLLQGRWTEAQLLWRSEGGDLLLFAGDTGRTHALTQRALERLHAEGLAAFEPPGSLIQRAVDGLLASLAEA